MRKTYVKYNIEKRPRYLIQLGKGKILGWSYNKNNAIKKAKELCKKRSGQSVFIVKEIGFVDTHALYS
jgi:hypothetical protein